MYDAIIIIIFAVISVITVHLKSCFMPCCNLPLSFASALIDIIDINSRLDQRPLTHHLLLACMVATSLLSLY